MFDALRQKVLSAIQIDVVSDIEKRNHVLETYAFTIRYKESAELGRDVMGLQFESFEDDAENDDNIHEDLIGFVQQMDDQFATMTTKWLPGKTQRTLRACMG